MSKLVAAVALVIVMCGLGGCSSGLMTAPVRAPVQGGPLNPPPNECYTDDGYGRWQPCGNMS
jgi:hypothetical protein